MAKFVAMPVREERLTNYTKDKVYSKTHTDY